ncbi:MAG: 6-pyruvoyl-tetrahydropterin synthase-related protein [Candidatus Levybacteria bacterium]|nr:6-pyruvoyl-tetrahydropterin synthase-related protein [Candidatus Levybacteria bacterium]
MILSKKRWGLIAVFILSVFSILSLFHQGFFAVHDDTQVARVYEMGKALKDGMFPVRWAANLGYGYGYPIFNFYAPLAYYIGGFLTLLGFDALLATKLMIGLGVLLSGIFMYLLTREFWGELGGIVSALFYVYAPYHALDIYVRGDVGEFWAYAFIPLMALGFYKGIRGDWGWMTVGAVGFAGVILSHNLTAMMIAPIVAIVSLFHCYLAFRNKKNLILNTMYLILPVILGLLLSAFYWLPALLEMQYTNVLSQIGGGADFRDHFVCIQQLWSSPWRFGGSTSGCIDGMSFRIGKLHLVISLLAILSLFIVGFNKDIKKYLKNTSHLNSKTEIIFLAFLGFAASIFLTLEVSKPIWEAVWVMAFFQYPWRFLILSSFFSSILAGSVIWYLIQNLKKIRNSKIILSSISIFFIFLLLYSNVKLFVPEKFNYKSLSDYISPFALRWTASKISDEFMPQNFSRPKSPVEIVNNKIIDNNSVQIINSSEKTQGLTVEVQASKDSSILIKTTYFPSWNISVDGKKSSFEATNEGLVVPIEKGEHSLKLEFISTPVEKAANVLSLSSILIIILGIIYQRRSKNRE